MRHYPSPRHGLAVLAAAFGFATGSAFAAIVGGVDVPALVRDSDLVVVGHAKQVHFDTTAGAEKFSVAVDRTLKGGTGAASSVDVRLDLSQETAGTLAEGDAGLFFLRRTAGMASYVATDADHPALALAVISPAGGPATSDALANVAHELAGVLASPDPGPHADELFVETAAALMTIPYAKSGTALRAIADSGAPAARIWAVSCLLSLTDDEALKARYLDSLRSILLRPGADLELAASALAHSLPGDLASTLAAPTLAALSNSSHAELRAAAMETLAEIQAEAGQ